MLYPLIALGVGCVVVLYACYDLHQLPEASAYKAVKMEPLIDKRVRFADARGRHPYDDRDHERRADRPPIDPDDPHGVLTTICLK